MTLEERVRQVLNNDWDPLNVRKYGVTDEYDSYIAKLIGHLEGGDSAERLTSLLSEIASDRMHMDLPLTKHWGVAEKLRGLLKS